VLCVSPRSPSPQDQLLCDVVEDWACGDHATPDEISRLWRSINEHIEQSCTSVNVHSTTYSSHSSLTRASL
jgi:hypothetical protein